MTAPGGYTTSQRNFSTSVPGIDGEFATFTGGEKSKQIEKAWNGGAIVPDIVPAPTELSNIVIGRPYNPRRDQPIIDRLRVEIDQADRRYTIRKQPLDGNDTPVGKAESYTGCTLVAVRAPEYDRASSTPGRFELEFAPQSVA